MTTEKGIIIKVEGDKAWVKTMKSSACEHCKSKDSCNTLGGGKEMKVEAINVVNAKVDDHVVISFDTSTLLKVTFFVYMFPILSLLAGAVAGDKLALIYGYDQSGCSAAGGFLLFFIAYLIVRFTSKKIEGKEKYIPKVIRIEKKLKTNLLNTQ